MHKVDKLLRLYVGRVAKFNKAYARSANTGRKKLMEDIKTSRFKGNDDELLEAFLELLVHDNNDSDNYVSTIRSILKNAAC